MIADNEWNLRCPDCGGTDAIDIAATVWVRLCPDGTDATLSHNGDHGWDEDSSVCCAACGFQSQVRHLRQNARDEPLTVYLTFPY
jgi:hypothetical protein